MSESVVELQHDEPAPSALRKRLRDEQQKHAQAPTVEWSVRLDQVHEALKLLQIISNVLEYVTIRVCDNPPRIEVDHIDKSKVCMLQARLMASSVVGVQGEVSFCVKAKALLACLSSAHATCTVVVQQCAGSSDVELHCYDPFGNSTEDDAVIKTVIDDSTSMSISDMTFGYTVVMKLKCLRKLMKTAQDVNAVNLRIQMYKMEPSASKQRGMNSGAGRKTLAWRFVCEGGEDATPAKTFIAEVAADDENNVIRTEDQPPMNEKFDRHLAELCYDEIFLVSYINSFIKAMDRDQVMMKIGYHQGTEEALPLVIEYPLDPDNTSYVNFVLAVLNDAD